MSEELFPLPGQPAHVAWPTCEWPCAAPGAGVDAPELGELLDTAFAEPQPEALAENHALVVIHRGVLVAERYGCGNDANSTLISWSVAKSLLHALVGLLVRDGRLALDAPAAVPAWRDDPARARISLRDLLQMQSGLRFVEDYVDAEGSDCIEMLFGSGQDDVAGFAETLPLLHAPGAVFSYSSGTSNIVSAICARAIGGGAEEYERYLRRELLERIGMRSATLRFDATGTWIGSSFCFATARDFARFGLLYLRDGVWEGERVLPPGWVDFARRPTRASKATYGAHWWLAQNGTTTFHASGYRGQYIAVVPERDLVVVRLGGSDSSQRGALFRWLDAIVRCFPGAH